MHRKDKVDNAMHRISHYPLDSAIGFPNSYPWDSATFELLGPELKKAFRHFLNANRKKTFQTISSYNFSCKKKV